MTPQEIFSILNGLIETCKDGEQGFHTCAADLQDRQLQLTFQQRADSCAQAAAELQDIVRAMGGVAAITSSVSGSLHRRWVDIKSLVTGKDNVSVLTECERGEAIALQRYQSALEKALPPELRTVVERQLHDVEKHYAQVKNMRESAQAAAKMAD